MIAITGLRDWRPKWGDRLASARGPYFVTPAKVVRAARGSTFPSCGLPPREERGAPRSAASSVAGRACKAQRAERATGTGHDARPGRTVRPMS